ncbi:MAG: S8 family serine peptidase [Ignavibacteria bacterium]|nr:S8 family serine peptidase [Ignavibacteria bacterium]
MKITKILLSLLTSALIVLISFSESETNINTNSSLFSKNKFFVKTGKELRISEATGKISLFTGIKSLDEKINKFGINNIKKLFNLNKGNPYLYSKYGMERIYVFNLDTNNYCNIEDIVKEFNKDNYVEFSEPDFIGMSAGVKESMRNFVNENINPNDEMFYKQWYLSNFGSVDPASGGSAKVGADIKILNTWDIESGNEEVIVAILDSGIRDEHPDLKDRIWINKEEIPGNGIDDDYNGYADDYKGWDFAYDDRRPEDGFGHGTNIATVIGASTDNVIGFAGVDKKCRLMNCKNLNADNTGEYSWWSESIKYAVDNGADIINMSEGGDDYSRVLETAVKYAVDSDVLVVSAMMNKGDGRDYYPASFEGVMAVGATDTDDSRCKRFSWGGGSCWGNHISVVAPGNKIYGLDYENDQNYEVYWSGTSQSTAIVSGIASLLKAQKITRTSIDLKRIIRLSSKDLVGDPQEDRPGWDKFYGYGRVDSYAAITFEDSYPKDIKEDIPVMKENPDKEAVKDERDNSGDNSKPARAVDKNSDMPDDEKGNVPAKKK